MQIKELALSAEFAFVLSQKWNWYNNYFNNLKQYLYDQLWQYIQDVHFACVSSILFSLTH